jgi:hypothetical protein
MLTSAIAPINAHVFSAALKGRDEHESGGCERGN